MRRRHAILAALLTLSALPPLLAGCGGGGASAAGVPLSTASVVTTETLDTVEDILTAVVRTPNRSAGSEEGTATESYLSFANGYEAVVRRGGGGVIEGRISGPAAGLPARYRIEGGSADVHYTDGTTQQVKVP